MQNNTYVCRTGLGVPGSRKRIWLLKHFIRSIQCDNACAQTHEQTQLLSSTDGSAGKTARGKHAVCKSTMATPRLRHPTMVQCNEIRRFASAPSEQRNRVTQASQIARHCDHCHRPKTTQYRHYDMPTMMLLIGMKMSFTKKPINPIIKKPMDVACAIFVNSARGSREALMLDLLRKIAKSET